MASPATGPNLPLHLPGGEGVVAGKIFHPKSCFGWKIRGSSSAHILFAPCSPLIATPLPLFPSPVLLILLSSSPPPLVPAPRRWLAVGNCPLEVARGTPGKEIVKLPRGGLRPGEIFHPKASFGWKIRLPSSTMMQLCGPAGLGASAPQLSGFRDRVQRYAI